MTAAPIIGVVCGLAGEARLVRAAGRLRVVRSGPGPEPARRAAEQLIAHGAEALVSFGLCGGLDPLLEPGMLLLPDAVLAEGGEPLTPDPDLRELAMRGLRAAGLRPHEGALFGAAAPLAEVARKAALFEATRACAVDMESRGLAAAATAAGRPWLALRAVADPAGAALPRAALAALGADGRVRLGAVLGALLRRPGELPALVGLARDTRRAYRTLALSVPVLDSLTGGD